MNDHPPTAPIPASPPVPAGHEQWRLVVAQSASEARSGTAYIMSATALIVWAIQYYGFHGQLPGAVSAALYVLIPTTIGWLASHVAFKKVTL